MTGHEAKAVRRPTGHVRWYASCPCGWTAEGRGKGDALASAALHVVKTELRCDCFVGDEFAPDPCPRCLLTGLLETVA